VYVSRKSTNSTFRISDPKNSMQDTFLLVRGDKGLTAMKIFPNFTEPSQPSSQDTETDRNSIPKYILFNSQGGMTVHLLELQPLKVLLTIPKITDEAI
jgi:hypothetical protein